MEKHRKLKKYQRKDYSQTVSFPVEIVGRDGVVRTYSFEESVRLYQRRIASASIRYSDKEVVAAEVGHCRQRISQIRRSYLERFGWEGIRKAEADGGIPREFAAEIAAFLRKKLQDEGSDPEDLVFSLVDERPHVQVHHLASALGHMPPRLLYLYRFPQGDETRARSLFQEDLRIFQETPRMEGVERLLSWQHLPDCGILLTGMGHGSEPTHAAEPEPMDVSEVRSEVEDEPDPYLLAMEALRLGEVETALTRLDGVLEVQPDHRDAVLTAYVVAQMLGQDEMAEMYARFGCGCHPDDGLMYHYLGLACLRQGRVGEARENLLLALERDPELVASRFLLGLVELKQGRTRRALNLLAEVEGRGGKHLEIDNLVRRIRVRVLARRWGLAGSLGLACCGLVLAWGGSWVGWVAVAAGCGLAVGIGLALPARRLVPAVLQGHERLAILGNGPAEVPPRDEV